MGVIVKISFIHINKPYTNLHYVPSMFTKYEKNPSKTVEVIGYTLLFKKAAKMALNV